MEGSNVVELDKQRPHLVIQSREGVCHIVPKAFLLDVQEGRRRFTEITQVAKEMRQEHIPPSEPAAILDDVGRALVSICMASNWQP